MSVLIGTLCGIGVCLMPFALIFAARAYRRMPGKGSGGGMGVLDEVFHPAAHDANALREQESVLPAPAPLAGDGDKGISEGRITITLN